MFKLSSYVHLLNSLGSFLSYSSNEIPKILAFFNYTLTSDSTTDSTLKKRDITKELDTTSKNVKNITSSFDTFLLIINIGGYAFGDLVDGGYFIFQGYPSNYSIKK